MIAPVWPHSSVHASREGGSGAGTSARGLPHDVAWRSARWAAMGVVGVVV